MAVTVRPNYGADVDLQGAIEYRRGPREGGPRVSLAWSDLCLGCSHDLHPLIEEVSLDLPEEEYISGAPFRVLLPWAQIVQGLRD